MVSRLRKTNIWEILGGIVIILTILLLINKYIWQNTRSKVNLVNEIENSTSKYLNVKKRQKSIAANIIYTKNKNHPLRISRTVKINLSRNNDKWRLQNNNTSYFLVKKNNHLAIKNQESTKKFKVQIEKIGESQSFFGEADLDLPDNPRTNKIRIYEQEDYLPIFGYHYVSPDNKKIEGRRRQLEIHLSNFQRQIEFLTNKLGCRWITFAEAMEKYIIPQKKLPRYSCVMTIDDGHKDGYQYIFPVLKKFNIPATFYIISGFIGSPGYLTWEQLDEIYRQGNEIGAHTVSAEGLVKTDWFEKKEHRKFTKDDLIWQISQSKKQLEKEGYEVKTFAYPLGEWNKEIVDIIKNNGFIAARDTSRDHFTKDQRTPTTGMNSDFIWHMHYFKPELATNEELKNKMGYNSWWQFEDGYQVIKDKNKNIHRLSSLNDLTPKTYEVVSLPDKGDQIRNNFLLGNSGNFTLEIFASTGEIKSGAYSQLNNITIAIDNKKYETQKGQIKKCRIKSERYYCHFFVKAHLKAGQHTLDVTNNHNGFLRLDKFKIFREFNLKENYQLSIIEYE